MLSTMMDLLKFEKCFFVISTFFVIPTQEESHLPLPYEIPCPFGRRAHYVALRFGKTKKLFRFLSLSLFIFVLNSCDSNKKPIKNQNVGAALGTSYSIIYLSVKEVDYQMEIDSVFEVVNRSLSTYLPSSDISKINDGDSTIVVDRMFKEVFGLSKEIHRNTDGYFDPTVGALVNAWGFGPGEQIEMDSTKVDSLLNFVGFDKVELTVSGTIKKRYSEIKFDFNAIAKGYAIDRLALMLDEREIMDYLVEVGGEVLGKGKNRIKEKDWVVGIDDPEGEGRTNPRQLIYLKDRAMASSGNYIKFRIDEGTGEKYVHTIDPKTGYTRNSSTLGTTVLADNCAKADGYATAFMAMDLIDVKNLLLTHNEIDAYIIYSDEQGVIQEYMTEGFKKVVVKE